MFSLLLSVALAQSTPAAPALDEDETARTDEALELDEPDLEITIYGESQVKAARKAIDTQLTELGYTAKRRRDGRTVYVHEDGWRQKVVVDDDGFVYFRQRPPHVDHPPETGREYDDWPVFPWLICVVVPTACVNVGSIPRNRRLKQKDKERFMTAAQDELVAYSDALAGQALQVRLYEEVPALMDSIWLDGVHLEQPELSLPDAAARRAAILEFWLSRTDNTYGDAVRQVVEAYMAYVINESKTPFTEQEISKANAERRCERELVL